jgi:nucleotide-binding universal stress UspA family protein
LSEREGSQPEREMSEREGSQPEREMSEREGSRGERETGEREGSRPERETGERVGRTYRRIVVGVDGSSVSRDALRWAAEEAELRDCTLDVVYGWQVSTEPRPPGVDLGVAPPLEAYQRQAEKRVAKIVAETLGPDRNGRVTVHAVHRTPGRALIEHSREADLLVLGSKGRGRLAAWLLGSISEEAVQRSPCSVVIVRPRPGTPSS